MLQICSSRFGVIIALKAKQEIQAGEEFFANYNYMTASPRWYKELFLRFTSNHPEDVGTIQWIVMGRSRGSLNIAYQMYLKQGVNLNRTEMAGHRENTSP